MKPRWVGIALISSIAACGGGSAVDAGASDAGSAPPTDAPPKMNPFEPTDLNALINALKTRTAGLGNPAQFSYLILPKSNRPFWQDLVEGAGKAGRDIGVRVELSIPEAGGGDQAQLMEDAVARGVNGVAVAPTTSAETSVAATITNLRATSDVQIMTIDTDSPGNRQLFVGNINTAWGVFAANQMAQLINNTGKVLVLMSATSATNLERRQGIVDGFASTSIQLVTDVDVTSGGCNTNAQGVVTSCRDVVICNPEAANCNPRLDAAMDKHPDLAGIISTSSFGGAYLTLYLRAATAASGTPQTVKLLTIDLSPEAEGGLIDGTVAMVLVQNAFFMGYVSVHALYAFSVLGEAAAKEAMAPWLTGPGGDLVDTGSVPVTIENLAAFKEYQLSMRQ